MKLPLIRICLPPSQEVSEVNKGKGVLDWSRYTLMESISTPRRSHTADIASLKNKKKIKTLWAINQNEFIVGRKIVFIRSFDYKR